MSHTAVNGARARPPAAGTVLARAFFLLALGAAGCHEASPGPTGGGAAATSATTQPATPPAASASAAPPSSYRVRPVTDGHTVEVRLAFAGKPRAPWAIPAAYASHCGGATTVADPSDPADGKGGVAGAVAWVDDVHEGEAAPAAGATIDQKGCAFAPHVVAVGAGATLALTNGDPANHAVRLDLVGGSDDASVVKMIPPGAHDVIPLGPAWAGHVGRITCPIHPWMLAWVHVFEHPYFAVTQAGIARIARVPPGTWHVSVWHEALDARLGDTLTEGRPVVSRFPVTVKDRDVVLPLTLDATGAITVRPP